MRFYLNGNEIDSCTAKETLDACCNEHGFDPENISEAWANKAHSEEAREFLNEVSGYELEFVTED